MKVNFAAGVIAGAFGPEWLNIDYIDDHGIDQQVNLLETLPANIEDIELAYIGHFLEHVTWEEGVGLLERIRERMQPEARLVVVGPDVDKARVEQEKGRIPDALWRKIPVYGGEVTGPDRNNQHLWDCTGAKTVTQLESAGWVHAQEHPIKPWPFKDVPCVDTSGWQFLVTGRAS